MIIPKVTIAIEFEEKSKLLLRKMIDVLEKLEADKDLIFAIKRLSRLAEQEEE